MVSEHWLNLHTLTGQCFLAAVKYHVYMWSVVNVKMKLKNDMETFAFFLISILAPPSYIHTVYTQTLTITICGLLLIRENAEQFWGEHK